MFFLTLMLTPRFRNVWRKIKILDKKRKHTMLTDISNRSPAVQTIADVLWQLTPSYYVRKEEFIEGGSLAMTVLLNGESRTLLNEKPCAERGFTRQQCRRYL